MEPGWLPRSCTRARGEILYIGIDELSRRKGHVYVTNVYDLNGKRLLWSGEGRSQETLRAFFASKQWFLQRGGTSRALWRM